MEFYNLQSKTKSGNIKQIFSDWKEKNERVVFFSPHDDDAILGAAYILLASLMNEGEVFIVIFNDGSAGYSKSELKNKIVEIRKKETINAFNILGIKDENISRFDIPDFSGIHYLGWKLPWNGNEGLFPRVISTLRKIKATRLIFPNGYREHIDHTAICLSAMFDGPQAGDSVIVDYGEPSKIKSFIQYSVWAKFSPEDALMNYRDVEIRANRALVVERDIEQKVTDSLMEFKTQQQIISDILEVRKKRRLDGNGNFIELYLDIDPRPRFDYEPYKKLISEIDNK